MARPGAWQRKGRGNGTHAVGMIEAMEHPHFVPYGLFIPLTFFFGMAFSMTSRLTSPGAVRAEE